MNFSQSFYNDNEQTNYETAYTILRKKEFEKGDLDFTANRLPGLSYCNRIR